MTDPLPDHAVLAALRVAAAEGDEAAALFLANRGAKPKPKPKRQLIHVNYRVRSETDTGSTMVTFHRPYPRARAAAYGYAAELIAKGREGVRISRVSVYRKPRTYVAENREYE